MTLVLAPYNDSMKLGQGFNSYTHELCIDKAISFQPVEPKTSQSTAQTVSYSSRQISKLSDIVDSLNISPSNAIKKGTIEISGNTTSVDENTFKESDITFMVSVKVTNQTTNLTDDCTFNSIPEILPGTRQFDELYGDCFISGFIEGGDLTGIISVKAIDRSKSSQKVNEIKAALSLTKNDELVLDPVSNSGLLSTTRAIKDTETTISVSWMGGGQIKDEDTIWDIDSLYAAAAAFPYKVANCPRRTWAILTKYKANRSFVETFAKTSLGETLQYEQISAYTAELFDSFMDYKLLLKYLQNIIRDRNSYFAKYVANAIDTSIQTLLSVKSAFRLEQSKIVEAILVLSRDPDILKRQSGHRGLRSSPTVTRIITAALGDQAYANSASVKTISNGDGGPVSGNSAKPQLDFDFDSLVPPEVWADLMPEYRPSLVENPLNKIGLSIGNSDDVTIPTGPLSQTLDTLRRQLEAEKTAHEEDNKRSHDEITGKDQQVSDLNELLTAAASTEHSLRAQLQTLQTALDEASRDATSAKRQSDQDIATANGSIADLKARLNTASSNLSTTQAALDTKSQQLQAAQALVVPRRSGNESYMVRGKVEIMYAWYGGRFTTDSALISRLLEAAEKHAALSYDPYTVFQSDPLPGSAKQGLVMYRYVGDGEKGLMPRTICWDYYNVRGQIFDVIP